VNKINQLLIQAQTAHDTADWSLVIQCLQQLTVQENLENPEIAKNTEKLLEFALAVLTMGDFQQRWEIAQVLSKFGAIAIPQLISILEDDESEEELHWYAMRILGDMKNSDAIAPLVELIKSNNNEELKGMAAAALGEIGTLAIFALTELLKDRNTRLLAVQSLSYIRNNETITPLLSVVEDSQVAVRVVAIEALSSFHDQRVPSVLLNALNDVASSVRREAVIALGERPGLCAELDLVTKLKSRLYDSDEDVCCAAAIAMSKMGSDSAAYHLFEALIAPNRPLKLQLEIIRALMWVGTLSGLEYLHSSFYELESVTLWQEIVAVLGRVNSPTLTDKALQILLDILHSKHAAVEIAVIRSAIALSLGQLGNIQALEPLTAMLTDQDPQVRLHASAALKNLTASV
jgi:HEAT repeat protein